MTELQISLMAIGGALLVGVIGYNKWQEYRARKTVERAFSPAQDDVLMNNGVPQEEERREPVISGEIPEQLAALSVEPDLPEDPAQAPTPVIAVEHKELPVDEVVDCIVPLAIDHPVRGEKILTQSQALRHVGNKPVHFIGQRADDGAWEAIVHGTSYGALKAGVQLATRHTALNEIEYSEFIMRLRQIADHLDAEPAVPDMTAVMTSARHLHQFVHDHDAQLSVNVVSNGAPWAINTLMAALERQGFDFRPDGHVVMPDGEGGVLFSLSTNVTLAEESTSRLTLLLDVPCVSPSQDGFGAMTSCARMLATRLDGNVVDDANQPLSATAIGEIAQQVAAFHAEMESADIPAGSTRALRLFS